MKVFYSYSHRDESFRAELEKHLTLLKQQNLIDESHDRRIAAGADIREDIDSHFEQSEIIILLLSPDFLLSPECNKEMDRAITRQQQDDAIVIPVILRPCAWMHSDISHLKALPTDGKPITTWQTRDDAFVDIYRAIKDVVENTPATLRDECKKELVRVEFVSQHKSEIHLNDIFVFPNIEDSYHESTVSDFSRFWKNKQHVMLRGDDRSGKTVICRKLFLDEMDNGSAALLLSGSDIHSTINHESLITNKFREQFKGSFSYWERREHKLLIIDDITRDTRLEFLEYARSHFDRILVTISEDEHLAYFKDDDRLADFELFTVRSFGHARQETLVKKWLDLHRDHEDTQTVPHVRIDQIEDRVNSIILHNRIVPRYPFYILSILQTFEAFMPQNLQITTYGHCYQALITAQLLSIGVSEDHIDSALNFLSHLSFAMFRANGKLSPDEFKDFLRTYRKTYVFNDHVINRVSHDGSSILRRDESQTHRFKYYFTYYFFLGHYLARNYVQCQSILDDVAEASYVRDNAYILTFSIHHAQDDALIDSILLHTACALDDVPPSTLETSEVKIIEAALAELPESIMSRRSVEEERQLERSARDEAEPDSAAGIDKKSDMKILNDICRALKNMEIVGQILRSKFGSLPRDKLSESVEFVIEAGLRLIAFFSNRRGILNFEEAVSKMLDDAALTDAKKQEAETFVRRRIRLIVFLIVNVLLKKIVDTVRKSELQQIVENVCRTAGTPAHEILYTFFLLTTSTKIGDSFVAHVGKIISDCRKNNNKIVERLLSIELQHHLNTHSVDYRLRQKIYGILGLTYQPNPVTES